ncbi:hypothetical protein ACVNPZ_10255 [Staphylococcus aureus]
MPSEDAKLQYKKYKSLIDKVKSDYFSREADDLKADMQQLARVKYLARIVKDVMSEFNRKSIKNVLEFDYEHFALQILTNEMHSHQKLPNHTVNTFKKYWSMSIKIRTDLRKILSCIKTGDEHNGNLFMVGDVSNMVYK